MMDKKEMAINLIIKCEGIKLSAYKDSGGIPTIGIGTVKFPDGKPVKMGDKCTIDEAKSYLKDHLNKYVFPAIDKLTAKGETTMPDTVYAALCSFVYNLGEGALKGPSIAKALAAHNWADLAAGFKKYVNVNGQFCQGLANRRDTETKFFLEA